jgi:hypothetical protein
MTIPTWGRLAMVSAGTSATVGFSLQEVPPNFRGAVMQAFTLGPARWRTVRAFGRNPVVRISDRVEAMVVALAVAIALVAVPAAGAVGTTVYEARSRAYAEAGHMRHTVTAVVTSRGQTAVGAPRYAIITTTVHARWRAEGIEHTDAFKWDRAVAPGNQIEIWVDTHGRRVNPAPSPSQAAFDAVRIAVTIWLGVVAASAALVALVRWRLDRLRDAAWEREISSLADNGGGRTNTQP